MKTCPECGSTKKPASFSAVKNICNMCHLDGKVYVPKEKVVKRKPTEAEIVQAELAARTLARRRLIHFTQRFKPDYTAAWVHHDICRRLEQFVKDVEARKSPRLLLCMPPRSGKSELTSRNFPAWVLGHHPEWEIIAASHTQSLSVSFSRHIRDKIRDPAYEALFPDCALDPNSQSVENWMTTAGGGYLAAGVGSGITGRGCFLPNTLLHNCANSDTIELSTLRVGDFVYGYDHEKRSVRAVKVLAVSASRTKRGFCRVEDIVCTDDHEFCTSVEGGYTPAGALEANMPLVRKAEGQRVEDVSCVLLPGASNEVYWEDLSELRGLEGGACVGVQKLSYESVAQSARDRVGLRQLPNRVHEKGARARGGFAKVRGAARLLLEKVLRGVSEAEKRGARCMRALRSAFVQAGPEEILLSPVLLGSEKIRGEVCRVQRRVSRLEKAAAESAEQNLCDVRKAHLPSGGAPHRPQCGKQQREQLGVVVLSMSQVVSHTVGVSAADIADSIQDQDGQLVVDIQTETGNFFVGAAKLLVHNCHVLIVDDPVRDMSEADSQLVRDNTWDWYTCFHPETEILTYDGWKPVSEVALREAVATMDMSSGEMYYMPAVEAQSYDFDGELVDVWQRSGVSYRVTPNHNLHIASSKTGPIRTVRADETPETFYIPRSAKVFLGGNPPARTGFRAQHVNGKDFSCATTTWFKFFGAWLGDGSIYAPRGQVVLSAIKPRKRKFFTKVLSEMGVMFWEQERRVTFQNVEVARYLGRFGGSHEKYIPENMKHAATPYLEALLEGLFETDGHAVDVDRRYRYVTTSKQLADDVMEIAVKCGYAVSYSVRPIGTYHLSLRKTYMTQVDARVRGKTNAPVRKMVPYKGKVHCVTVPPHHSVLIRDRGRISWSGQSTAYTRLAPGGGVLGIMTLWNDDDWGGRTILYSENGEGDKFEIVRYPAINEGYDEYQNNETLGIIKKMPADPIPPNATLIRTAGSALHPERYDIDMLTKIKRNMYASGQQRVWSALYQQNPAPEEGAYFTKDQFGYYSTPPRRRGNFIYQAWDFAIATGQENDYTVGVTLLQDERDNLYVLHVTRFKSNDSIYIVDVILDYAAEWDADLLGFEDGQIWKTMQAQFDKRCEDRKIYPTYEILRPLTDKKARANPLKGRMQANKVLFDKKAPWFHDVYSELLRFPAGKHDDCSSATTLVDSPNGPRQMIDLRDGDEILTYDGHKVFIGHVANHHCTGVKMVLEVTLEDGTRLELTAGHPVLTARGYVYAGDLLDSDEIVRKEVCAFYATVSSGHRSQAGTGSRQHSSTEKDNGCTDTLGSRGVEPSLLGATSTTLTETDQTTTSRTFSALHGHNMMLSTVKSDEHVVKDHPTLKFSSGRGSCRLLPEKGSTSVTRGVEKLSTECERAQLAEQSSNWVRRTTTQLLTVLRLVSKKLAESTPSGSTTEPCHASSVGERSYLDGTESVIASSALSHAVTSTDTQTSTSVESVKGAVRPYTSRLEALHATAEIARLLGRTCEKPNAQPAGQRFYPETRMAAYSAIENVLTSCEDLSVTQRSMSDSNRLFVKVVSIREIGFQETYNFDVAGTRNFLVENGIVVHNCVDALAWAVRLTLTRSAPKVQEPVKITSWKDKLLLSGGRGATHMSA